MPCIQARRRLWKNLLLVNTVLPHASEGGTVLLTPLMYTKDVYNLSGPLVGPGISLLSLGPLFDRQA